jgi:hypothetical protein
MSLEALFLLDHNSLLEGVQSLFDQDLKLYPSGEWIDPHLPVTAYDQSVDAKQDEILAKNPYSHPLADMMRKVDFLQDRINDPTVAPAEKANARAEIAGILNANGGSLRA